MLGPLLFLIYVNDIFEVVHNDVKIRLFADDCLIYCHILGPESQVLLNSTLVSVTNWCTRWDMKINCSKTVCATITLKKRPLFYQYTVNNSPVRRVKEFKYLGVTFSSDLSWNVHVKTICCSARNKLFLLRRKLRMADTNCKLTAYKSVVRPVLEYAAIVWSPYTKALIDELERVQRLAVRFICSDYKLTTSATALRQALDLEPLAMRRKIARISFLYQILSNDVNIDADKYCKIVERRTFRKTHNKYLQPYHPRVDAFKYSFFVQTIELWNALPSDAIAIPSIDTFRNRLHDLFTVGEVPQQP